MLMAMLAFLCLCAGSHPPECHDCPLSCHYASYMLVYRKMFIGGLNWDTTDGTYIVILVCPPWYRVVLNRVSYQSRSENISHNLGKWKPALLCGITKAGHDASPS